MTRRQGELAPKALERRTATEVFDDHLSLRSERRLEDDLVRNYSPDVLVITSRTSLRGKDGIRQTAATLREHCGDAPYEYLRRLVQGDFAYLVWQVSAGGRRIHGADSFRISEGKIVLQTIHYLVMDAVAE